MRILGVNNGHDPSAALVIDGELVVFIEEERLNRVKHGLGLIERSRRMGSPQAYFPDRALCYCLRAAGLSIDAIDAIVLTNDEPDLHDRIAIHQPTRVLSMPPGSHHLCHAYATFYASDFNDASVFITDHTGSLFRQDEDHTPLPDAILKRLLGGGDDLCAIPDDYLFESESVFHFAARGQVPTRLLHNLHPLRHVASHGLGAMYAGVCSVAGFFNPETGWDEAGKLMGLSGYGQPLDDPWTLRSQPGPQFDFEPFRRWLLQGSQTDPKRLAAEAQRCLEHCTLQIAQWARENSPSSNLCIGGGVGLNVHANALIEDQAGFDKTFVLPCCTDAGNAIGAAFWFAVQRHERPLPVPHLRLGRTYPSDTIDAALLGTPHTRPRPDELITELVRRLMDGQVIAWFEGGSEGGPRALGHRSLLADPRRAEMRDHINLHVKGREPFRPLAPIICSDDAADWFERERSPFMLRATRVLQDKATLVPAIVHVDGSARPQTVKRSELPRVYALLKAFGAATGVPMLVNTSFNGPGQPIIETPRQAIDALSLLNIDALVLHDRLVLPPDLSLRRFQAIVNPLIQLDDALERPHNMRWMKRLCDQHGLHQRTLTSHLRRLLQQLQSVSPAQLSLTALPCRPSLLRFFLREKLVFQPDEPPLVR